MELFFPDFSFHDKSSSLFLMVMYWTVAITATMMMKIVARAVEGPYCLFRKPSLDDHLGHCIVGITRSALGKRIRKVVDLKPVGQKKQRVDRKSRRQHRQRNALELLPLGSPVNGCRLIIF